MKKYEDSEDINFLSKAVKGVKDFIYDTKVDMHTLLHNPDKPKKEINYIKQKKLFKLRDFCFIWSILLIPLLNLAFFWVYGTIKSIPIAFEQYSPLGDLSYGFANFEYLWSAFKQGGIFKQAFGNTLKYFFFGLLVQTPLSYLVAYFLYKKIKGHKFFRYIFFVPSMVSSVIISSLFLYLVGPDGPVQRTIADLVGDPSLLLLRNSSTAFGTMLFYNLWVGLAGGMIMNLAAFTRIPTEVIEAGILDGVNIWQEIRHLILPLTWPFFGTMMMLNFTSIFSAGGPALLLTGGAYGTYDLGYYVYELTMTGSKSSQAVSGAIGLIQSCLTLPIALIVYRLTKLVEPIEF